MYIIHLSFCIYVCSNLTFERCVHFCQKIKLAYHTVQENGNNHGFMSSYCNSASDRDVAIAFCYS